MKTFLMLASLVCAVSLGFAQAEPGTLPQPTSAEAQKELASPAEKPTEQTIQDVIDRFLEEREWTEGENVRDNGSVFYISVGYGAIPVPPSDAGYMNARINAFKKAMLDAKAGMSAYLESSISAASIFSSESAKHQAEASPLEKAMAEKPDDSLFGKAVKLISLKLDRALKEEGYDINAKGEEAKAKIEAARRRAKELLLTEKFKEELRLASYTATSGMQAHVTIESPRERQIAVLGIWSPLLANMAASLVNGRPAPTQAARLPIRQQLPADSANLIDFFGIQQKVDENGNLVLVSYGQAVAHNDSSPSQRQRAYNRARLDAFAQIRVFAGETVTVSEAADNAEQHQEYIGEDVPDYSDESSYDRYLSTAAKALKVNGISVVRRWQARHTATGKTVYGVVCAWSPKQAIRAVNLLEKSEENSKYGAEGQRVGPSYGRTRTPEANPGVVRPNLGIKVGAGDDDSF